ncbi:hypothetical protein [Cupriavidus alkaliphilus]|uniref:hypothetical protein n=1 Tax=Cupriavidus alkaliphilus TaxID=942866 RepID=UPI00339D3F34
MIQNLKKNTTQFAEKRRRFDAVHVVLAALAVGLLLSLVKQQLDTQAADAQAARYARVAMWAMSERDRDIQRVWDRTNDIVREMAVYLDPEVAAAFKDRLPLPRIPGPQAKPPVSPTVDVSAVLEVRDLLDAWRKQAQ